MGAMNIASGLSTFRLICLCLPLNKQTLCAKELVGKQHKLLRKVISSSSTFHPDCELIAALGHEPTPFWFTYLGQKAKLHLAKSLEIFKARLEGVLGNII